MSVQPAYASLGYVGVLNSGTANTNRDGTGTINTFAAASLRGLRVEREQQLNIYAEPIKTYLVANAPELRRLA